MIEIIEKYFTNLLNGLDYQADGSSLPISVNALSLDPPQPEWNIINDGESIDAFPVNAILEYIQSKEDVSSLGLVDYYDPNKNDTSLSETLDEWILDLIGSDFNYKPGLENIEELGSVTKWLKQHPENQWWFVRASISMLASDVRLIKAKAESPRGIGEELVYTLLALNFGQDDFLMISLGYSNPSILPKPGQDDGILFDKAIATQNSVSLQDTGSDSKAPLIYTPSGLIGFGKNSIAASVMDEADRESDVDVLVIAGDDIGDLKEDYEFAGGDTITITKSLALVGDDGKPIATFGEFTGQVKVSIYMDSIDSEDGVVQSTSVLFLIKLV